MNHKAECLKVIPVPNRSYYEMRTICVCGLSSNNFAQHSFESALDNKVKVKDLNSDDEYTESKSQHLE